MDHSHSKLFPYEDILHLPHPVSSSHPPMPVKDRAAQFAPFAALTGYHDAVREASRFTDEETDLDENIKDLLDEKLRLLQQNIHLHPQVTILYFLPDGKKAGGTYASATGFVKKVDDYHHMILLQDGTVIPLEHIRELSGTIFM